MNNIAQPTDDDMNISHSCDIIIRSSADIHGSQAPRVNIIRLICRIEETEVRNVM